MVIIEMIQWLEEYSNYVAREFKHPPDVHSLITQPNHTGPKVFPSLLRWL